MTLPMTKLAWVVLGAWVVGCGGDRDAPTTTQAVDPSSTSSSSGAGAGAPLSTNEALAELQAEHGWGQGVCETPTNAGYQVGDQLDDLVFKACDGTAFDVRELCGADAVWISVAHAWCPHCQKNADQMEGVLADFRDDGHEVAGVNVLVHDHDFDTPTEEVCEAWRTSYGQRFALTLFDDEDVNALILDTNQTALNMVIDADRVITAKVHTDVQDTIRGLIDDALP